LITAVAGTIFFYIAEVGINTDVHNLGDAFWYILPTMATDGRGITPHTISGRIISMTVMIVGILFFEHVHSINSLMAYKKIREQR
jgi:hypothetical protein